MKRCPQTGVYKTTYGEFNRQECDPNREMKTDYYYNLKYIFYLPKYLTTSSINIQYFINRIYLTQLTLSMDVKDVKTVRKLIRRRRRRRRRVRVIV